jgi:nitrogen fixation NifU-like protein
MDPEVKREIIMDNYLHPLNKETVNDSSYEKVNSNNESCIDNIDIYVKIENDTIKDIKFDGEACAISTSSTSIMINNLIGMSVKDAINYIDNFDNMVNEKEYDEDVLNEAIVYNDIYKQNNRKHCALLPYIGIRKILESHLK